MDDNEALLEECEAVSLLLLGPEAKSEHTEKVKRPFEALRDDSGRIKSELVRLGEMLDCALENVQVVPASEMALQEH